MGLSTSTWHGSRPHISDFVFNFICYHPTSGELRIFCAEFSNHHLRSYECFRTKGAYLKFSKKSQIVCGEYRHPPTHRNMGGIWLIFVFNSYKILFRRMLFWWHLCSWKSFVLTPFRYFEITIASNWEKYVTRAHHSSDSRGNKFFFCSRKFWKNLNPCSVNSCNILLPWHFLRVNFTGIPLTEQLDPCEVSPPKRQKFFWINHTDCPWLPYLFFCLPRFIQSYRALKFEGGGGGAAFVKLDPPPKSIGFCGVFRVICYT